MRLGPMFLRVSAMCRFSTMAAPRAVMLDWSELHEFSASGASLPRLMLIDWLGSGASWANTTAVAASASAPNTALLRIYIIDRDVARIRIYVASPHGTLCIDGKCDVLCARIHQPERMLALPDLNAIDRALQNQMILGSRARRGMFEHDTRDQQRHHAGEGH